MASPAELENKPKKYVQDYITPLNALCLFPATMAMLLDFLSPFGPFLIYAAVLAAIAFIWSCFRARTKVSGEQHIKKSMLRGFTFISLLVFSGAAVANFSHRHDGGLLAHWQPKIKTWQDFYLNSIKNDTTAIRKGTDDLQQGSARIETNVAKMNVMLAQLLDTIRPQLEKTLIDEVDGYKSLKSNQKDALMLLTSKVGTNGIKRYHGLLKAVKTYADAPSEQHQREIFDHIKYVVRINGKNVEDEKTRKLIIGLFIDQRLYDYLTGFGTAPDVPSFYVEFNIDPGKAAEAQISDPLGDMIRKLEAGGQEIHEAVVIPKTETVENPSKSKKDPSRRHPQPINGNATFM